ncbi:hypothetical protein [Kordiimonas sp. SCSIO 12610]|uniref:hypothetical protein n=1 Tax=Kordiimonas sp. SCSIO 12610 TaxID=2829597 RepID=UPI00210A3576|nr:hypothetical protein [Kordiimonas sp. SCSIO 12610]UTW56324.1 hypothetical protein KFF44_05320 [Kordiimonas sp. SCSIO 12610]
MRQVKLNDVKKGTRIDKPVLREDPLTAQMAKVKKANLGSSKEASEPVPISDYPKLGMQDLVIEAFGIFSDSFSRLVVLFVIMLGITAFTQIFLFPNLSNLYVSGFNTQTIIALIATSFVSIMIHNIMAAFVVKIALEQMTGEKKTNTLSWFFSNFLFITLLSFLIAGLVVIAGLFFVLPGIYLNLALFVVIPVYIYEQKFPQAALLRSIDLTKGYIGHVFLLNLGITLTLIIVFWVASLPINLIFSANNESFYTLSQWVVVISEILKSTLNFFAVSTLSAVIYMRLRYIKEGHSNQDIEAVFE